MPPLGDVERLPRTLVPRVLTVHGKYQGPNLYRCWWPNGYLATKGFVADFCSYDRFDEQHGLVASGRYNIIVTPRIAFATERAFNQWHELIRATGMVWVYDADDDLWSPEFPDRQVQVFAGMPDQTLTRKDYELERLQRIFALKRVDAVTVTTPRLVEIARRFTDKPVYVIPNLMNTLAFEHGLSTARRDVLPLTIGWSGTRRQEDDLAQVADAWRIIAKRYPHVKFIIQGYHSQALAAAAPLDRVYVMRAVTVENYPSMLRNIDIACCAVSDDPWNTGKSAVKFFEATLAGAACVVSEALYGPYVEDGYTGLVARTTDEWVRHLALLIEDEDARITLQRNAREYVMREWSLDRHWSEWVLGWSEVLDDRRKLGANTHASDAHTESRPSAGAAAR